MLSKLRKSLWNALDALEHCGLSVRPVSGRRAKIAGVKVQWSQDDPSVLRGAVVTFDHDGIPVSFFVERDLDFIQREHLAGRFYEMNELEVIQRHFRGGCFVDIGANVGNHSIYALKVLGAKEAVIFEPNPPALRVLKVNLALNDALSRSVLHECGLSDEGGAARIIPAANNLGASRLADGGDDGIRLARGDDLLAGKQVDFIKIDTEGFEMQVLRGLVETIRRSHPALFVEVEMSNIPAFSEFCGAHGYKEAAALQLYPGNINFLMVPR